jgi:uncharacterized membrane protein
MVLLLPPAQAQDSSGQRLILNVYLDSSGKALVTGYAENASGLAFLNNSQFRFENDSHQLYALTAGLTTKVGDLWTLHFNATGSFDDYRVTFYLPTETRLGKINASQGLGYLLSASNESLVADVQGWEVSDPCISIQYHQPLAASSNSLPLPPGYPGEGTALIVLVVAAALMVAGFGFAVFLQKWRRGSTVAGGMDMKTEIVAVSPAATQKENQDPALPSDRPSTQAVIDEAAFQPAAAEDDGVLLSDETLLSALANEPEPGKDEPSLLPPSQSPPDGPSPAETQDVPSAASHPVEHVNDEAGATVAAAPVSHGDAPKQNIAVSSEMEAVMQTLTVRERAVMSTLIAHGGRMTQAEIRYETGTPKSSLTGILISLERRKLVIKKEWGRTNIIELSEWFLSKKERS